MISSEALRPANAGRKGLGKLAARLEEVKNPWRQGSTLELSHNEAARLATDALLESGEKEYRRVLTEEKELNFLSSQEIKYISDNAAKNNDDSSCAKGSEGDFAEVDAVSELTSGTYFPMMSDEEPPLLELGWPDAPQRYGPSETQIYFQRDKSHNVKDLIRSLINKAKKVIALVMDLFTDVDLICDLMEASNKRKVPVYILLDEKNLNHFIEMCTALDIHNSHLCNMRIRSVIGETYCTKSGKKFTGQVQEKFLIIDCEEVIAGSYSFTWLSAQVHSNMVLHFTGRIAEIFDREFRCLYADSQIIDRFHDPEEEGIPMYSLSTALPNVSFGVQQERYREKVYSEHSSSLSSGSVSSIKKAPNMPNPIYRVNHDKKEPNSTSLSPERRAGLSQGPHTPGNHLVRGVTNGQDLAASGDGLASGIEWSKAGSPDCVRPAVGGATSKIQALGLYEAKPTSHVRSGSKSPPGVDVKINTRHRSPSTPFLNKITEFFSAPGKDRDTYNFSKPQLNPSAAFGGPDLTQTEPESKQKLPFPAPLPTELMHTNQPINRRDLNRMTLGHSKLDLVNHYNQMKPKHAYSRFESKNNH